MRAGASVVVVTRAVDHVNNTEVAAQLVSTHTGKAVSLLVGGVAILREERADVVGVEIVSSDAVEAGVRLRVVGLAVEDGITEHAESVVDDVVGDAGEASAREVGSQAEPRQALADEVGSGSEEVIAADACTAEESRVVICLAEVDWNHADIGVKLIVIGALYAVTCVVDG